MADLVVTVPKNLWADWIYEGDAVDEPETGEEWGFFLGPSKPPIEPGERLYVVAHGLLRGYAPVTRVAKYGRRWAICRRGGAVAVTIPEDIKGFRGHRRRWWPREAERPFPIWSFARVPQRQALEILMHRRIEPDDDRGDFYGCVWDFVQEWIDDQSSAGRAGTITIADLCPVLAKRFSLEAPDAETLALWVGGERKRWRDIGRLSQEPNNESAHG